MKKLAAIVVLVAAAFAPALSAQATPFEGKWEGTFTQKRPDGTDGPAQPVEFVLTQKGKALTGTGGPVGQSIEVQKGLVTGTKATWEMHLTSGMVMKFDASIVKDKLLADVNSTAPDGSPRAAKIEMTKAAAKK